MTVWPAGWLEFWVIAVFLAPHPQPPPLALQDRALVFVFCPAGAAALVTRVEDAAILVFSSTTLNEPVYMPIVQEKRIVPAWVGVNSNIFSPSFNPWRIPNCCDTILAVQV